MTHKKVDPKNVEFRIDSSNVSTQCLAQILGMTTDAVTKLHSAGIIKQNGKARGKYDLFDAVNAYLDHLRANKGSDVAIRLTLARARKLELENDRREKELVRTSEAVEVFAAASTHWKSIADGLPKRIASRLAKIKNPGKARTVFREALDGLYAEFEKGLKHLE
jgi:phage terminase Nu1 subunit (DNA packaging protein)